MEEKKIKFELSRVALIFVILFGLCILIWTFIFGVWIGTKIGGKPTVDEPKIAKKPELSPISPPVSNLTNVTESSDKIPSNITTQATPISANETKPATALANQTNRTEPAVAKEQKSQTQPSEVKKEPTPVAEKQKRELATRPAKEEPKYQKKEVAQLATKIKEEPSGKFTIQVGAFSQRDKAEQMKQKIRDAGYTSEIREINQEGKTLYKVYLGRFSSREEAEKIIPSVKNKLGIDRPFIVELK